jgi:alkylation response protein AidB-like acyl-CoA dehydrogenase
MQFQLDEDRQLLQRQTRELLEKEAPLATSRAWMETLPEGFSRALFEQLGSLGYPSLLLPEAQGGLGALAFAAVLHEMGRVALPGPFLDLALAVRVLGASGSEAAKRWRERAASGAALVVLARAESLGSADPGPPTVTFAEGRVRGTKQLVPFGAHADALLVETTGGLVLVERPAGGWDATAQPTLDHAQRFASVTLDAPGALVLEGAAACRAEGDADRLGALGAAALLLGLMERALEITVAYLKERVAFGAPIGSFQALQHRAADMLLQTESARSAVYRAAWAEESGEPDAAYLIAVAKAWAGSAARVVCGEAVQMHGGVGFTWEYDPHIYLKRSRTLEQLYGSTAKLHEAVLAARKLG